MCRELSKMEVVSEELGVPGVITPLPIEYLQTADLSVKVIAVELA